jgi:hypothetical protein
MRGGRGGVQGGSAHSRHTARVLNGVTAALQQLADGGESASAELAADGFGRQHAACHPLRFFGCVD